MKYLLVFLCLLGCNYNKNKQTVSICSGNTFYKMTEKIRLDDSTKILSFKGKFLKTEGIFRYSFEDVALYPSSVNNSEKALWLNLMTSKIFTDSFYSNLDGKKVILIGKVNTERKGHFNGYLASLDSVLCIEEVQ